MGHRGGLNASQSAAVQKSKPPIPLPKNKIHMPKSRPVNGSNAGSTPSSRSASASTVAESSRPSSLSDAPQRSFSQSSTVPVSLQEVARMERRQQPRLSSLRAAFNRMRLSNEFEPEPEPEPEAVQSKEDGVGPPKTPNFPSHIPTASSSRQGSPTRQTPAPSHTPTQPLPAHLFSESMPAPRWKTPAKTPAKTSSPTKPQFLNKCSNLRAPLDAWDGSVLEAKMENMENMFQVLKGQMEGTTFERSHMKEIMELMRARCESSPLPWISECTRLIEFAVAELEAIRNQLTSTIDSLKGENEETKVELSVLKIAMQDARRQHEIDADDMERKHRYDIEELRSEHRSEIDRLRRNVNDEEESVRRQAREEVECLLRKHRDDLDQLERHYRAELEEERTQRIRDVQEVTTQRDMQLQNVAVDIGKKEREAEAVKHELDQKQLELERHKMLHDNLETKLAEVKADMMALESSNTAMQAKIDFLESGNQAQSQAFADLHKRMQEAVNAAQIAEEKLRAEESLRRKLHNQVQELKGNIRVFCRVRPSLADERDNTAKIRFPDACEGGECREIVVTGPEKTSSLGNDTTASHGFSFDRVFGPTCDNGDVFEEISQLVQSALDGYNVCIFCYGQTGSGKTYTMSAEDGMIPRATAQIYESAKALEEKGWSYAMEGSFVEVYNENLNDLLGKAEDFDKKKHEIRHDSAKCKTAITDISTVTLNSADAVTDALQRADRNRSVAATKANQRSSRSHSVFILSLVGENSITGERSEGTLNLVDLAGSERLSHSQAEGQRLKETQNINKSLSCLGDVIGALGRGEGGHVPYRNSKVRS